MLKPEPLVPARPTRASCNLIKFLLPPSRPSTTTCIYRFTPYKLSSETICFAKITFLNNIQSWLVFQFKFSSLLLCWSDDITLFYSWYRHFRGPFRRWCMHTAPTYLHSSYHTCSDSTAPYTWASAEPSVSGFHPRSCSSRSISSANASEN